MNAPQKLTYADHSVIEACSALVIRRTVHSPEDDRDREMMQDILREVLHDATVDNPRLQPFITLSRDIIEARSDEDWRRVEMEGAAVLLKHHRERLGVVFDPIRERYFK